MHTCTLRHTMPTLPKEVHFFSEKCIALNITNSSHFKLLVSFNFIFISGKYNNFVKYEEGTQVTHLETHYDYGSVMHYSAFSFNIDPDVPTVIPKDPEAEIGQRTHLSECDIVRLQMLYGCIDEVSAKEEPRSSVPSRKIKSDSISIGPINM